MQDDKGQYDLPDERLRFAHEPGKLGEGRDLGRAEVVHTWFGKVKVRVTHEQAEPISWLWLGAGVVVVVLAVMAWKMIGSQDQLEPFRIIELPTARHAVPELPAPVASEVVDREGAPMALLQVQSSVAKSPEWKVVSAVAATSVNRPAPATIAKPQPAAPVLHKPAATHDEKGGLGNSSLGAAHTTVRAATAQSGVPAVSTVQGGRLPFRQESNAASAAPVTVMPPQMLNKPSQP